jgi:hypothetical protein
MEKQKVRAFAKNIYRSLSELCSTKRKTVFLSLDISARYVETPALIYPKKTGCSVPSICCEIRSCVHITVNEW